MIVDNQTSLQFNCRMKPKFNTITNAIKAMGLVFGDIGTSPIYTMTVIFLTLKATQENIIGVLSLILWTLILLVSIQYAWFAMSLSKRGEGGAIVLNEVLIKFLKSSRPVAFFSYLTYIGVSLLIGDSVITPAISILSAVEGLAFIPHFAHISQGAVVLITVVITLILFSVQKKGVEKVTSVFGPIMLVWFVALGISGVISVAHAPIVLSALNPLCGLNFILHHGFVGFIVLSEVILCATGAEALYADMGHLGRDPIIHAWCFVFLTLLVNYAGQAAYLLSHPGISNILFSMISSECSFLFVPFLLISILATIIASQAMISGLFSVIYQAMNVRILPLFKIDYTSEKLKTQIYIGTVNCFLLISVIAVILFFRKSSNLAAAYGFSVSGAMTVTCSMIAAIFFLRKMYLHFTAALGLLIIDICFLLSVCSKIPHGAYWSILIALVPLSLIILYISGHKALYRSISHIKKDEFIDKFTKISPMVNKICGTALFFARSIEYVPPYVIQTMFTNNIIYSDNIFVSVNKLNDPHGVHWEMEDIIDGIRVLKINTGYMEILDLESILRSYGIHEKAIFYGVEDIETTNPFWIVFDKIKKITPSFIHFYKLPVHKIHGVMNQISIK